VLVVLFLGFSGGLPLALSGSTLLVWLREAGVDLGTIGLFALAGTPYTIKFLWAPIVDGLDVPVLSALLGRRRGWLVLSQLVLIAAIVLLGFCDPARNSWYVVFAAAAFVATASATQDIVIDAFRIESLPESEQAAGMASYVAAYRIGMLASTAGALFLVSGFDGLGFGKGAAWTAGYIAMAALVVIGMATALIATEPERSVATEAQSIAQLADIPIPSIGKMLLFAFAMALMTWLLLGVPLVYGFPAVLALQLLLLKTGSGRSLLKTRVGIAAVGGLLEFFKQDLALVVFAFVILFKFTDALSGAMTAPFVIDLGFTRNEYAAIIKGVGLAATLLGGFAGGFVARAFPLAVSLLIGGVLQALANLAFSAQAIVGHDAVMLTLAIVAENFTSAIGTVIFVAYLSALCNNPLHTATQYALLTALAAVGRTYLAASAGYIASGTGWVAFFAICAAAGIPSLVLLAYLQRRGHFAALGARPAG
jgi:MFS transporter, PAT family, beta-lactamase induction signal transducer AmpG